MLKRSVFGFLNSCAVSTIALLIIELVARNIFQFHFSPITPEFEALFPSTIMAIEVDILLYGVIGFVFSFMSFIFEKDRIGFILQNIIYCFATGIIWIPIITFIWQLWRYPEALFCTIIGFVMTYIIISISMYHKTRREVAEINKQLQSRLDMA